MTFEALLFQHQFADVSSGLLDRVVTLGQFNGVQFDASISCTTGAGDTIYVTAPLAAAHHIDYIADEDFTDGFGSIEPTDNTRAFYSLNAVAVTDGEQLARAVFVRMRVLGGEFTRVLDLMEVELLVDITVYAEEGGSVECQSSEAPIRGAYIRTVDFDNNLASGYFFTGTLRTDSTVPPVPEACGPVDAMLTTVFPPNGEIPVVGEGPCEGGGEQSGYPSDDCNGGANVVDGFLYDSYVRLRTASAGTATAVCVAVERGTAHHGGKVVVSGAVPGTPTTDAQQGACAAEPTTNTVLRDGSVLSQPYRIEVNQRPGEVWVCVRATTFVGHRVVIPVGGPAVPSFSADPSTPNPAYVETPAVAGEPSADCQSAGSGRTRVANVELGSEHVWLYTWQSAQSTVHVCTRARNDARGARLSVDGNGGQTFVGTFPTNLAGCSFQIIDDSGPPPFSIYTSPAGAAPVRACLKVGTSYVSVQADSAGGQTFATVAEDS